MCSYVQFTQCIIKITLNTTIEALAYNPIHILFFFFSVDKTISIINLAVGLGEQFGGVGNYQVPMEAFFKIDIDLISVYLI